MKELLVGAGIAAVAGILIGAAAKPDLGWDDRPAGPQILSAWGAGRSTGPFDDGATLASYKGQMPDYVLGSDWKRALNPPEVTATPSQPVREARLARNDDPPDLPVTRAAYEEPPHAAPNYPSVDGGQAHGSDLLPPAHPEDSDSAPTG